MVRRIDLRQNTVPRVTDEYFFSSAALSMFRFDMTLTMCLKPWAWLEFQYNKGISSSLLYPPSPTPRVIMSSHVIFRPTPTLLLKWWRHLWTAPKVYSLNVNYSWYGRMDETVLRFLEIYICRSNFLQVLQGLHLILIMNFFWLQLQTINVMPF